MRIVIITDNVPRSFDKWMMYKIPRPLIKKVIKNSAIILKNGIEYVFTQQANKVRGMEIKSVIVDECYGSVKQEIIDEALYRVMSRLSDNNKIICAEESPECGA